jgi:uncharacterized membrane protein YedE/YeeE
MKQTLTAYLAGLLFALGLGVSGMTQPGKILAFLDVAGVWDPQLLFVMGGAVIVTFIGYRLIFKRAAPLLDTQFYLPAKTAIDTRLLIGAGIFGIGWGLGGYCPGPAVTSLVSGLPPVWVFVTAMLAGFYLYRWLDTGLTRKFYDLKT